MAFSEEELTDMLIKSMESGGNVKGLTQHQIENLLEMKMRKGSPGLPSVDRQSSSSQKEDRVRALELTTATNRLTPSQALAFINGESTTTLQTPLTRLLESCYTVFVAQDTRDYLVLFDRVTDMRDAFGGVLAAMDELGIPRPKVEGAVDQEAGKSDG